MLTKEILAIRGFTNKRCSKCGGNIFMDKDFHGWYEQCLQCGKSSYLPEVVELKRNGGRDSIEQNRVASC